MTETNRLSKIYTRSGDKGETSLANGERVSKCSARIEALGTVDELNSLLGLVISGLANTQPLHQQLSVIQHQLFDLGGELAVADKSYKVIDKEDTEQLEQQLDLMNRTLPPLKEFILPGGSEVVSRVHLARTVCRRAERTMINLQQNTLEEINADAVTYLNRLSDFLFVAARFIAKEQNEPEVLWKPKASRT